MSSPKDNILAKEIKSWKDFEYALCQQYAEPFNKMLKECLENEEYAAASDQGPQRSSESLFMALIFQQQKMISKLMKQIESEQREE
jgi:hypothetical protein